MFKKIKISYKSWLVKLCSLLQRLTSTPPPLFSTVGPIRNFFQLLKPINWGIYRNKSWFGDCLFTLNLPFTTSAVNLLVVVMKEFTYLLAYSVSSVLFFYPTMLCGIAT